MTHPKVRRRLQTFNHRRNLMASQCSPLTRFLEATADRIFQSMASSRSRNSKLAVLPFLPTPHSRPCLSLTLPKRISSPTSWKGSRPAGTSILPCLITCPRTQQLNRGWARQTTGVPPRHRLDRLSPRRVEMDLMLATSGAIVEVPLHHTRRHLILSSSRCCNNSNSFSNTTMATRILRMATSFISSLMLATGRTATTP